MEYAKQLCHQAAYRAGLVQLELDAVPE